MAHCRKSRWHGQFMSRLGVCITFLIVVTKCLTKKKKKQQLTEGSVLFFFFSGSQFEGTASWLGSLGGRSVRQPVTRHP